ncbi:spore germination protein [Paenibacillus mucilaginosus]|uniref:Spore germination protein KA n=1 Tax=Paenibacillus mucilaginosus (strain KNP414) TaxID=1036673 RepID=F8F6R2_PAEMK|nr:spore germination protein [Paenibacillus mucilaginosus]AEI43578.1 spore germination protein KA [Paenibacillus mucilaginosus KNP414]MCG7211887.1 spore germination protein [Paenibacillus mucilaginosus]WDM25112.1 spore germination protein [Paenibacillus mucilaginosus]
MNKGAVGRGEEKEKENGKEKEPRLSVNLAENVDTIKRAFSYPVNRALVVRELFAASLQREVTVLFLEGATDTESIESQIIQPLVTKTLTLLRHHNAVTVTMEEILTSSSVRTTSLFQDLIHGLVNGGTILLIQGEAQGLTMDTPGFQSRSITEPQVEHVLKGPKEAFIESAAANRSLIRKQVRDHQLMSEVVTVGERSMNEVSLMYIKNLADPDLVTEVKQRISEIQADTVPNLSMLEQHIEERSYSLIPTALLTERPDRASSFLMEGHVILIMENSPTAMVVPITFWSLFHTPEDQYLRWAYGNFIRIVRIFAVFVALLTPSLYIAVSTFHEEMLPTDLLLAIGATRERVPFPALIEVLLMEAAFELVREAAVRIPTIIGPTIGIVGALILGQAAVEANIVSPILVIIVAMTGISSFTIPEISFNFAVRILRFIILFTASFMGFFGIALTLTCVISYMVSFKSFGVPFLTPLSPHDRSSKDLIVRPPVWKQWLRPFYTNPQDKQRKKKPEGPS